MPQVLRLARLGLATAAEIDDEAVESSLPGVLVSGVNEEASSSLPSLETGVIGSIGEETNIDTTLAKMPSASRDSWRAAKMSHASR